MNEVDNQNLSNQVRKQLLFSLGFNYARAYWKSVSVKRRLRTADCRLRTRGKMQAECKMQTAD